MSRRLQSGSLLFDCHAEDGTVYPEGTRVKFEGSIDALMNAHDDGVVPVLLPNGEERGLEPDAVDWDDLGV